MQMMFARILAHPRNPSQKKEHTTRFQKWCVRVEFWKGTTPFPANPHVPTAVNVTFAISWQR